MEIIVEVSGQLLPGKPRRLALTVGYSSKVEQVAILLGLSPEEIGLITINGVQSEMEDSLYPDCRLCFFPPLSGG